MGTSMVYSSSIEQVEKSTCFNEALSLILAITFRHCEENLLAIRVIAIDYRLA
jgi:hypothetical protein